MPYFVETTHVQRLIKNALALAEAVDGEEIGSPINTPDRDQPFTIEQCLEKAAADLRHAAEELTAERLSCEGWLQR